MEGKVSPDFGYSFTLSNDISFGGKHAGEYLEIRFEMSFSGETNPRITHITLNGENVCSGGEPSSSPGNIKTNLSIVRVE